MCIEAVGISLDLAANAPPATGNIATDAAIKNANMVRATFMIQLSAPQYPVGFKSGQVTFLRD